MPLCIAFLLKKQKSTIWLYQRGNKTYLAIFLLQKHESFPIICILQHPLLRSSSDFNMQIWVDQKNSPFFYASTFKSKIVEVHFLFIVECCSLGHEVWKIWKIQILLDIHFSKLKLHTIFFIKWRFWYRVYNPCM